MAEIRLIRNRENQQEKDGTMKKDRLIKKKRVQKLPTKGVESWLTLQII